MLTLAQLNELKSQYKIPEITVDFFITSYDTVQSKNLDTARYILITATENGLPRKILEAETPRLRLHKPDNTYVYNDCAVIEDGRVLIKLTEQILASAGTASCDIQIVTSDKDVYATKVFHIIVDEPAYDNTVIESSDDFSALNQMIAEESDRVETVKNLENTINENEKVRNENENIRVENEETRQSNETIRQQETSKALNNIEATIETVNQSITSVNLATENANNATAEAEKVNVESVTGTESYAITITDRTGTSTTSPNLLNKISIGNVETGSYEEDATANITGAFGNQKLNLRLPVGHPFKIVKSYISISAMEADYIGTDVQLYQFVIIDTGNVEDEDNAKLYMKGDTTWTYITDLSGSQGIQGERGLQGIQGKGLEFAWNGTNLGVRVEGDTNYSYTDLKGSQGVQGNSLEFIWNGTQLGVRVEGTTAYTYTDLKGQIGNTPNITIGTVTTGAEGTYASADITGTADNPILNLTIPKGDTGTFENASASNIPYENSTDTNTIKDIVDNKIDKVTGKGLSANDFTDAYKNAIDSIPSSIVTGIKGNAESTYRSGNVNITPNNIGALPLSGGTLTGDLYVHKDNDANGGIYIKRVNPESEGDAYEGHIGTEGYTDLYIDNVTKINGLSAEFDSMKGNLDGISLQARSFSSDVSVGASNQPIYFDEGKPIVCNIIPDIINDLNSLSSTSGLSAYQGKILNDVITELSGQLMTKKVDNLNSATDFGCYKYDNTAINKPTTYGGTVIVLPYSGQYLTQIACSNSSAGTKIMHIRSLGVNGYNGWISIDEACTKINEHIPDATATALPAIAMHAGTWRMATVDNTYAQVKFYADKGTALLMWHCNNSAKYGVELLHFIGSSGGSVHVAGADQTLTIAYKGKATDSDGQEVCTFEITGIDIWGTVDIISHRCKSVTYVNLT